MVFLVIIFGKISNSALDASVEAYKIRYLQDVGGGGDAGGGVYANAAYLNEIEARRFVAGAQIAYSYDANGNMIQKRQGTGTDAPMWSYGYDFANRMNSFANPAGNLWQYTFAPTGERVAIVPPAGSGSPVTLMAYEGPDAYADYSVADGTTRLVSSPLIRVDVKC